MKIQDTVYYVLVNTATFFKPNYRWLIKPTVLKSNGYFGCRTAHSLAGAKGFNTVEEALKVCVNIKWFWVFKFESLPNSKFLEDRLYLERWALRSK